MKATVIGIIATLMALGLLPFALVARSRATQNENLPVHLVLDMDKQSKMKAQKASPLFADARAMRPEVEHTLAQEDLWLPLEALEETGGTRTMTINGRDAILLADPVTHAAVTQGRIRTVTATDEDFAKVVQPNKNDAEINADTIFFVRHVPGVFPLSVDFLKRGQERFNIYCAPCHGESGYGDGMVAQRVADLQKKTPDAVGGWAAPQNLHEAKIVARPDGHVFNTITNGIRNMPAYDKQISVPDRWAIIGYIRALEKAQATQPAK